MGKKNKGDFYAVARGLQVGIYRTWDEAKANLVHGIPNKHKKFVTQQEAEEYIEEHRLRLDTSDGAILNYLEPRAPPSVKSTVPNLDLEPPPTNSELSTFDTDLNSTLTVGFVPESSLPELVRIVELVSLPDDGPEWEWDKGDTSGSEDKSSEPGMGIQKYPEELNAVTGKSLLREYKLNYEQAETVALNYVAEDLHHPVISCFREVNKADVNALFGSGKLKKNFTNLEQAIVCIGFIDCIAVSINNPLYNENSKMWGKNVPASIEKVMSEFKGIIRIWGMSDHESMQKRVEIVLSYLRNLTKCFPVEYAKSFESTIINLENDISRRQKDEPKKQTEPLFELKINQNIFEEMTEEQAAFGGYFPPKQRSRIICDTTPSPPTSQNSTQPASMLISHANPKQRGPRKPVSSKSSVTKRSSSPTEDVIILESVQPAKKARIDTPQSNPTAALAPSITSDGVKEKGPPRNAFAILMDRSRQIAAQNKLKKLTQQNMM